MRLFIAVMMCLLILAGCESDPPKTPFSDIDMSVADAGSGEKLFGQSNNGAPNCVSCHAVEGESGGIGPSLAGMAEVAGTRVNGQSAEEYLYWSIVRPSNYLVPGYSNVMYADYETTLEAADIADVIAYILTLE